MASSSNHVEDNFDEIFGGLWLGEYVVVWDSRAMRPTPASSGRAPELLSVMGTLAQDGAEMAD